MKLGFTRKQETRRRRVSFPKNVRVIEVEGKLPGELPEGFIQTVRHASKLAKELNDIERIDLHVFEGGVFSFVVVFQEGTPEAKKKFLRNLLRNSVYRKIKEVGHSELLTVITVA